MLLSKPLHVAAAHAWQSGLKFPKFNHVKEITEQRPKEFFVFPGDGEGCPTVLWFTLSNANFKKLENYQPRSSEEAPCKFLLFCTYGIIIAQTNNKTENNCLQVDQ